MTVTPVPLVFSATMQGWPPPPPVVVVVVLSSDQAVAETVTDVRVLTNRPIVNGIALVATTMMPWLVEVRTPLTKPTVTSLLVSVLPLQARAGAVAPFRAATSAPTPAEACWVALFL